MQQRAARRVDSTAPAYAPPRLCEGGSRAPPPQNSENAERSPVAELAGPAPPAGAAAPCSSSAAEKDAQASELTTSTCRRSAHTGRICGFVAGSCTPPPPMPPTNESQLGRL